MLLLLLIKIQAKTPTARAETITPKAPAKKIHDTDFEENIGDYNLKIGVNEYLAKIYYPN